jgi:hypothetical protein
MRNLLEKFDPEIGNTRAMDRLLTVFPPPYLGINSLNRALTRRGFFEE